MGGKYLKGWRAGKKAGFRRAFDAGSGAIINNNDLRRQF
jgi:hypothetical protein